MMTKARFRISTSLHSCPHRQPFHQSPALWRFALVLLLSITPALGLSPRAAQLTVLAEVAQHTLAPPWLVIDLGTLGGNESAAVDINVHGQIVGWSDIQAGERHAFLWEDSHFIDLGTLGGTMSSPIAINDHGAVIGVSTTADGQEYGFYWADGQMTALEPLGGTYNYPSHLNEQGQVVGRAETANGEIRAYLWAVGQLTDLGTLGGNQSYARRINNQSQIVGQSADAGGANMAFLWADSVMSSLGTLGDGSSDPSDLNEKGQVVGNALTAENAQHAFLWENGVMRDLGTLGGALSYATRINATGQIMGQSMYSTESENQHAFLSNNGQLTDLGTLGGPWSEGTDLNEAGQIVGWSNNAFGMRHAFLWSDGLMTDLGQVSSGESSAVAINDNGWIVGSATVEGALHAFLWRTDIICDFTAKDEPSLQRAIACINGVGPGAHTLTITADIALSEPLPILANPLADRVIIEGNGHTIDAQGNGRPFAMARTKLIMRDLTLRGGRLPKIDNWEKPNIGGGLWAYSPNDGFAREPSCALTLEGVTITDNEAYAGGGIFWQCEQPLLIINSTVSNNRAVEGGGLSTSGGEEAYREMKIVASTFAQNVADNHGGAIALSIGDGYGALQLVNSTLSGNQATAGSGGALQMQQGYDDGFANVQIINSTLANNGAAVGGAIASEWGFLTLSNTIIADSTAGGDCQFQIDPPSNGQVTSAGYNLDSDGSCLLPTVQQAGDIAAGVAGLGPLGDNGGPTWTHALLPESAALDSGDNAVCFVRPVNGVDQRGVARPQGRGCEIGAYEVAVEGGLQTIYVNDFEATVAGEWSTPVQSITPSGRRFLGELGAETVTLRLDDLPAHGAVLLTLEFYAIQTWDGNQEFNQDSVVGPDIVDIRVADGPVLLHSTFSNTEYGALPEGEFGPYPQAYPGSVPGTDYPPGTGAAEIDTLGYPWDGDSVYILYYAFPHAGDQFELTVAVSGTDESESWGLDNVRVAVGPLERQLFVSSNSGGEVAGIRFYDEDILAYDPVNATWAMLFDGSDVGVTKDVNAFTILPDGALLLSFNGPTTVPPLGTVDDSDIVKFIPTQLGPTTAGNFTWYLKGRDVGLSTDDEDIDALTFDAAGNLVISTIGDLTVAGFAAKDEDLVSLTATGWQVVVDGSQIGLTKGSEDLKGAWRDPLTGALYLTTAGDYSVVGLSGDRDDIFVCDRLEEGENSCQFRLFWNGDDHGWGDELVDGLYIGALPLTYQAMTAAAQLEEYLPQSEEWDADDEVIDPSADETENRTFLPFVSH